MSENRVLRENIIVGTGTEYPLNGILTLPAEPGVLFPAVVMVHGSGPSNMDGKVMKLTPFKDLAEGLAKYGIASLRYDKRTFAHAKKMRKGTVTVREETIDDALLAVEMLKKDPRIDHGRIWVLGHSMGAMLAPRIDAEGADVKGLIMMAGSPYRLEEILLRQLQQFKNGNFLVRGIAGMQYKSMSKKLDGIYRMSDVEAQKHRFSGGVTLYYFKEMGQKTAADYLLETSKPVFLMQGEKDFQALADVDFRRFQELLAGRENTYFKLYPGLNHAFTEAISDNALNASKEYSTERHIGDEVISDIAHFIQENK